MALRHEAQPLIEHFGLRQEPAAELPIFRGEAVDLAICGYGKVAAAAATAYLHATGGAGRDAAWLNVGIAGHPSRPMGEAILAHRIRDSATGRSWYPPQVAPVPCPTDQISTVDRVETDYAEAWAYEMEAAGFYLTACRFATAELVGVLKVISDGPAAPLEELNSDRVRSLIAARLPEIAEVSARLRQLAAEVRELAAEPPELDALLARWRFTYTEAHQLRRLLRRRQVLASALPLPEERLAGLRRGGEVNRQLGRWLDELATTTTPADVT